MVASCLVQPASTPGGLLLPESVVHRYLADEQELHAVGQLEASQTAIVEWTLGAFAGGPTGP